MSTQKQININLNAMPDFKCPHCGSVHFEELRKVKWVAPFMAGNEKALPIATPCLCCASCGYEFTDADVQSYRVLQLPKNGN